MIMKKILVVDDDVDILTLVQTLLSIHDFNVEAILRWEDIDNRISTFRPDLVLLDVSLSGADGREICKKIKQAKETENLPVILFSANSEMGHYVQECRAETFIAKPFELGNFLQTIRTYLN